jgi:hypothetical protein
MTLFTNRGTLIDNLLPLLTVKLRGKLKKFLVLQRVFFTFKLGFKSLKKSFKIILFRHKIMCFGKIFDKK